MTIPARPEQGHPQRRGCPFFVPGRAGSLTRIVPVALLVVDGTVVLDDFVDPVRNPVVDRDFRVHQVLLDQVLVAFAARLAVVFGGKDRAVVPDFKFSHSFQI